jgi:hypothetical protein
LPRTLTVAKQREQYRLNGEAERLQFEEQAVAPCRDNPGPWMDWEDRDEPQVFEAQVTCNDCEFIEVCRGRARLERPEHGVFAGEVWEGGKIVRRARRVQQRAYTEAVAALS